MSRVRPLTEGDLPQILDLHNRLFGTWKDVAPAQAQANFSEVFFRHPWRAPSISSLIYETDDRRIAGCLGLMRRQMIWRGQPIEAAVSHNYMVDKDHRSSLAAIQLLKAVFDGPQDLCLAEGNDVSRKAWEGLGGIAATPYRFSWTYPLRPAQCGSFILADYGLSPLLATTLRPLCRLVDAAAQRLPKSPFTVSRPRLQGQELDDETVLRQLPEFTRSYLLRPDYDERSWPWLIDFLRRRRNLGTLRKICVLSPAAGSRPSSVVGWYVYFARPGGRGQVLQITAREGGLDDVLEHLLHDAYEQGVAALSGELEPKLVKPLTTRPCLFRPSQSHLLIHSRRRELLETIQSGQAFISRLEGEWWIGR